MPRFIFRGLLAVAVVLGLSLEPTAYAGTLTGLPGGLKCADLFNDGNTVCALTIEIGTITPDTVEGVRYLIAHEKASGRKIGGSTILLNSLGGDVDAAIRIGRLVRDEKLSATIEPGARCVSACVFILAGAVGRKIEGGVGIHRPYLLNTTPTPTQVVKDYTDEINTARTYLKEMGVAERLLDEMLRIEPEHVRFLSRPELDAMGLGEGPPRPEAEKLAALKEAVSIKAAKAYGVPRQEFIRRSALIDKVCKLGLYQRPDEPPDFSAYGRSAQELKMSKLESLNIDLQKEETGWSHCYKAIMTYGH